VLGLTVKNIMSFVCYLFSFVLFGLIATIVIVTPWRLKTNLCTNLAGVYKDIMAQEGDEGYEATKNPICGRDTDPDGRIDNGFDVRIVDRLAGECYKQIVNLTKDLLVIGLSPILIVSAQRWF